MDTKQPDLQIANTPVIIDAKEPEGEYVELFGEEYYRIAHYDRMPPFFMSLVSSADHWLFIASTGGLTAGRSNSDMALFPYETEDKIAAHSENAGGKTILRVSRNGHTYLWEPFSERYAGVYRRDRHLYKNVYGNKILFEEINHDLQLTMRVAWDTGDRFGFIRSCWLTNNGGVGCQVDVLDGLQNLVPFGATEYLQVNMSSLLNAYKRSELDPETGLGIYALSATLSDRAEPSESLKATVAWQTGLEAFCRLLSSEQLDAFRAGSQLTSETDVCGKPGAYFVNAVVTLDPGQTQRWRLVADVNQDSNAVAALVRLLQEEKGTLDGQIARDIASNTSKLVDKVAAADGLQVTAEETTTAHHFANVLFNIMRGGIFADGYQIGRKDLVDFVGARNRSLLAAHADWFAALPERLPIQALYARATESGSPDLIRLCYEYLPLTFSRRHGDPSRPWNKFSINLKHPDGSPRLDYQGNWRDIFQNWEPLAYSYPAFVDGMIAKFLNATTVDGYNPYRVTRDGIEWEVPEPENPWANIGYWSDHQIIYLQKLLEIAERVNPGGLATKLNESVFAYANVPYRIRPYREMLEDWNDTIDFDWDRERAIEADTEAMGTDSRLVRDGTGAVIHVTMAEKLLVLLLAKLTNLVPEGGIWMNTQRPEWNDANNALAGKGLSIVTVAYLRRFIAFWQSLLQTSGIDDLIVNPAVAALFSDAHAIFARYRGQLHSGFSDKDRRAIMDELGAAATAYRASVYADGPPAGSVTLSASVVFDFLTVAQEFIDQTLRTNKRPDGLIHSYNILHVTDSKASVENLYLMLEGQVALLSSGWLTPEEALALLRVLPQSALYRADQQTYMLYPNRRLPGFREKNNISPSQVVGSKLIAALLAADDRRLIGRDVTGTYHFNGGFHNRTDVLRVLREFQTEPALAKLAAQEQAFILDLFESTFNHSAFTGRSGTFYAYEGLGSVYWHMVSKLLLAAQECYEQAVEEEADSDVRRGLAQAYYDIRAGLGFNKTPKEYGAFPTDPYSHTPLAGGARQPGMTGLVKEEILARMGELGVSVQDGALQFEPTLLRSDEFLREATTFAYRDTGGARRELPLQPGSLAFTVCQTPVVYALGDEVSIQVRFAQGDVVTYPGNNLDAATTQLIFSRDGQVELLTVSVSL